MIPGQEEKVFITFPSGLKWKLQRESCTAPEEAWQKDQEEVFVRDNMGDGLRTKATLRL